MAHICASLWRRQFSKNSLQVGLTVLTGCDSGLGFSLARRCQIDGLSVVAGCLQPDGQGAKELADLGAMVIHLDVTKIDSVKAAAATVQEILRRDNYRLRAVVNNAGVMVFGEFEWQTPRLIETQVAINLLGYFNMAHEFLPLLQQKEGRLLNVVSHCALAGLPGLSVYGATKAAILNWSDTLRIEQRKYGVKVISVIPGSFFGESNIMKNQSAYAEEMTLGMTPEKCQLHQEYFQIVQKYLSQLPRQTAPKPLTDEALYRKIMHGLLSPNPRPLYKHEPLRYAIYHALFKICPTSVRDKLIESFVSLPKYPKLK